MVSPSDESVLSSLLASWVARVLTSLSMPSLTSVVGLSASLVGLVAGQYFPPTPEGVKVIHSKHQKGVTISYKEVCFSTHYVMGRMSNRFSLKFARQPQA